MHEVMVQTRLPGLHELTVIVFGERFEEGVTFRPQAGVHVCDDRIRAGIGWAEVNSQPAGSDERGDLQHFYEVLRLMPGDVPDGVIRSCGRSEDTIRLGNA